MSLWGDEEMNSRIGEMLQNGSLTDGQKRDIMSFAAASAAMRGVNKAKQEELAAIREEATGEIRSKVNPDMNAIVSVYTNLKGQLIRVS